MQISSRCLASFNTLRDIADVAASRVLGMGVRSADLSTDGRRVTTTHTGSTAIVWDWESDDVVGRAAAGTELDAIAQGGDWLFGRTNQGSLHAWRIPAPVDQRRVSLSGNLKGVATAVAADVALAWTDAREILVWAPTTGEIRWKFNGDLKHGALSDSGDHALMLATDLYVFSGSERKFYVELPERYEEIRDQAGGIRRWVQADQNDKTFVDAVTDESVPGEAVLDRSEKGSPITITRKVYWSKVPPPGWKSQSLSRAWGTTRPVAAIRGDGKEVAVSIADWVMRYDVETGNRIDRVGLGYVKEERFGQINDEVATVETLAYDSDGVLWISLESGQLWQWDNNGPKLVENRKLVVSAGHSLAFRPNASWKELFVHAHAVPEKRIALNGYFSALSVDGKFVATIEQIEKRKTEVLGGHNPGVFKLHLTGTDIGKSSWANLHIGAQASKVVFSPDASLIAMGDEEGVIRVWRIPDGAEINRLSVKGGMRHLSFAYDSSAILVAGHDFPKVLRSAPLAVNDVIAGLCSLVTRELNDVEWEEYMKGEQRLSVCHAPR